MDPLNLTLGLGNLLTAAIVWGLCWPLLARRVGPNRWYGFRFGKALRSERAWYDINEYGARRLRVGCGPLAVAGVAAFFLPLRGNDWLTALLAAAPLGLLWASFEALRYERRYDDHAA